MTLHLDPNDPAALSRWLDPVPALARRPIHGVAKAGEGNMNLTLRVRVGDGTVIVKQARPWVEKYPSIPAPVERAEVEAAFYRTVADVPAVAARMPRLLHHDPEHHVLVLEDLGEGADLSHLYAGGTLPEADLDALLAWLDALHAIDTAVAPPILANRAMRTLNHAHLFQIPFADDPDAIPPGRGEFHARVLETPGLLDRIEALGRRYLADGTTLLHGDAYPGSFLRTDGLYVIDPEFGFLGDPAFDHGVLAGHLVLARQEERLVQRVLEAAPDGVEAWAGVEILRRLLGVAQLPLDATPAEERRMVDRALHWLETP